MSDTGRLPDFLILGAAKAGTTAFFRAVGRHPGVFCSSYKEPRFFAYSGARPRFSGPGGSRASQTIICDTAEYLRLFAGCPPTAMAGEASTEYLASELAPRAAAQEVPRARLIAILRHPVERAYSQYLHHRHSGREPLADFEEAWRAEDERAASGWRPAIRYRSRGFYGQQLARWLECFPREQLLVLFYEDWLRRPAEVLAQAWRHLGREPLAQPIVTRDNVSSRQPRWPWLHHRMRDDNGLRRWAQRRLPLWVRDAITRSVTGVNLRPGPRLDPVVRARLAATYHDDLELVEALTGRELGAWRR